VMAHHTHTEIKPLGEFIHELVDIQIFHGQSPMRPLSNISLSMFANKFQSLIEDLSKKANVNPE
jgi:hypothetical protein